MTTHVDVCVVGAGIVGLASAWQLSARRPELRGVVLDKEPELNAHQTGRNSGVLHSGIYYKPGSMKARTAVTGRRAMVEFCAQRGIAHEMCGKVVVATATDELDRLRALEERARANGVAARAIGRSELLELEPHCAGIEALHVTDTGIADFKAVTRALAAELVERGWEIRLGCPVLDLSETGEGVVATTDGDEVAARLLLNCAGLRSDQLATRLAGQPVDTRIVPFRGEYYHLAEAKRHLVNNLIYPVPDPGFPFLGVHLTRMIDGSIHVGPNAVLALSREGYRWRDVSWEQLREHATNRGLRTLARRYWRTGAGEVWRSLSKRAFVAAVRRLVPEIDAADLERSPAGVRAQAMSSDGELLDDFAVSHTEHSVSVINAPSPAATASLEVGAVVADTAAARLDLAS
jgi:L-2-hydroxyglutarate oxidase